MSRISRSSATIAYRTRRSGWRMKCRMKLRLSMAVLKWFLWRCQGWCRVVTTRASKAQLREQTTLSLATHGSLPNIKFKEALLIKLTQSSTSQSSTWHNSSLAGVTQTSGLLAITQCLDLLKEDQWCLGLVMLLRYLSASVTSMIFMVAAYQLSLLMTREVALSIRHHSSFTARRRSS